MKTSGFSCVELSLFVEMMWMLDFEHTDYDILLIVILIPYTPFFYVAVEKMF